METLVECVPNFSEGRDASKVAAIIQALLAGPDVYLLDQEMDADHNRSVVTLVGARQAIGEAALRGIGKAAELIDLNTHRGAHPRLGATDVVPFVPIEGVTLDNCVSIAEWVADETWRRFRIPTYLYEAAARKPERKNLENIRRGQFEGVREEIKTNADRRPDFGENALHRTAGATVVGARKFLIAYNINLNSPDGALAKAIAKKIRASSGGFPSVKAMGVELKAQNCAQVSMNLTDFDATSIGTVFDAVVREASAQGVEIRGSEIVGLVPRRALENAAVHFLKIEHFRPDLIVENRLSKVLSEATRKEPAGPLAGLVEGFVGRVASESPTPGGGCVSALAVALGAALGEMVCRISLGRKSLAQHYPVIDSALARLTRLRDEALRGMDRDAESFDRVLAAMKIPKAAPAAQDERGRAVEEATKAAALVPFTTAEHASATKKILESLRGIAPSPVASDLAVALLVTEAGRRGAVENVRINLAALHDRAWAEEMERRLETVE